MTSVDPIFLELDEVLELHRHGIELYGGEDGIRDPGALRSAIEQPQASFGGSLLHPDLWTQAAAYLFHLIKNHPFVDGNKRVGTAAALIFLKLNGVTIEADEDDLVEFVLAMIEGRHDKAAIAAYFRAHAAT